MKRNPWRSCYPLFLAAVLSVGIPSSARAQYEPEADVDTGEPAHDDGTLDYDWYVENGLTDVYYNGDQPDADLVGVPALEVCVPEEVPSEAQGRDPRAGAAGVAPAPRSTRPGCTSSSSR